MATLEIRKETSKVWRHVPSDKDDYIVSKLYIKSNGDNIRIVEQGGSQRGEYNFADVSVFDIGGSAETFTSVSELMQRLEALGYIGFFYEGEVSPSTLISSDLGNIIELGSDGKLYAIDGGGGSWGSITGNLSDQTDLQNALDLKAKASDLGDVAFSNDYNDLDNLPTIPNNLEELHNVTETNYTTPIDADSVLTFDVTNSLWKRFSWANIKSNLKSYFDTLYLSLSIFNDFATDVFSSLDSKENVANKATNLTSPDDTKYPTTQAVKNALDSKLEKPTYVINNNVSGTHPIDFNVDTHRLTLIGNTTFTEINLPASGFSKTITLHINGNFGVVFPASWTTFISGEYNGTATLNTIVIETIGNERKVQISQPD